MSVGKTCVYVSMVSAKDEWPSTSITTRGATPWAKLVISDVRSVPNSHDAAARW
jgi:hypothetical protein